MKKNLLALVLLAGSSAFARNSFSFGISIGVPPPRPPIVRYVPPSPGYGYVWVPGYYSVYQNNYRWQNGYYVRPPHRGAKWVQPRYRNNRYFPGYWR
ncbi:MAG: hypothetical protein ABI811_10145 [Acidobacteriota bacterium]